MPHFDHHCQTCIRELGYPYEKVHRWLDAFAGKSAYAGVKHRRERHHQEGINEVIRLYGEEAGKAARLHIIADLKQLGWTEKDSFPVNKQDYENLECLLLQREGKKKDIILWWE